MGRSRHNTRVSVELEPQDRALAHRLIQQGHLEPRQLEWLLEQERKRRQAGRTPWDLLHMLSESDLQLAAVASPQPVFGPYTVVSELGRGGMGRVYRARERRSGDEVALKVLYQGAEEDELARLSGAPLSALADVLLELELAGRLDRRPGGLVALLPE